MAIVTLAAIPLTATAQTAAVVVPAASTPAAAISRVETRYDLAEVIERIQHSESAFRSARLTARLVIEQQAKGATEWQEHSQVNTKGWFTNRPGGPGRVEFTQHICPWLDGAAPFSESDYIATYNGRVGLTYLSRTGSRGKAFAVQRGAVLPDRPNDLLFGVAATGWRFTILGFFDEENIRFSEVLRRDHDLARIEAAPEHGSAAVRVILEVMKPSKARKAWTLDMDRGAALLAYEHTQGEQQVESITVEALQPSPGGFLPKSASRRVWLPDSTQRESLEVSEAVLDAAPAPEDTFSFAFPVGTVLDDKVSDVVLRIGPSATMLPALVAEQSASLRESLRQSSPLAALHSGAKSEEAPASMGRWVLAAFGLAIVIATVWRLRCDRRSVRLACGSILACMLCATQAPAQQRSLGADELGSQRIYNCGLSAAAVVLEAMNRSTDIEALAKSLDCGAHWENATSLRSLQLMFESRGLTVEAGKDASPLDIVRRLDGGRVALVHCDDRTQDGHYLVLGGARGSSIFLVDPGARAEWVEFDWFARGYGSRMSGFVLFVAERVATSAVTYTLQEDVIDVDLGDVSEVDGMVSADVPVRNSRAEPVTIVESLSSCSCFRKACFVAGDKVLGPSVSDTLRLTFDRGKFAIGKNVQQVYLGLLLPAKKQVLLRVSAIVRSVEVSRRVTVMPTRLDLKAIGNEPTAAISRRVTLLLPAGVSVGSIEATSPILQWRLVETTHDRGTDYRAPSRTEAYEVSLSAVPERAFVGEIVFQLSDEKLKTVRVPVLADLSQR